MTAPSLRDALRGEPATPEFSVVLPNGWAEFGSDDGAERALLDLATTRLRAQHRPDLVAQLRGLTGRAFAGLRSAGTRRVFLQTDAWTDDLVLPLSITSSIRSAPDGGALDAAVATLIREQGATALRGDTRFLRWVSDGELAVGSTRVGHRSIAYLTPVPGTERRRALQLTAVAVHPLAGREAWAPVVDAMGELSDAIASTVTWRSA